MPKILLVGHDINLLRTRTAVLEKTGADVTFCNGADVLKLVKQEMPDLVVLCHSLREAEAEEIARAVHEHCRQAKTLMVVSNTSQERLLPNDRFDATALPEPTQLIARANELLQGLPALSH
jgi:CheY-like chemotaxis protein